MKRAAVEWASQHDWYVSANQMDSGELGLWDGGSWEVLVYADGAGSEVYAFTDYQELRNWAGY